MAEPRPDMNIKVAAFTVSDKSSNIILIFSENLISCSPDFKRLKKIARWVIFHDFLSSVFFVF